MTLPPAHSGTSGVRTKAVCAAAGVAVVAAMMGAALLRSAEPRTLSQVRQEIREILLSRSHDPHKDDGGIIGPWHVAASSIDESTGEFCDFRLRSGTLNLGAARARLEIDPLRSTFSFKLRDVVIVSVPDDREEAINGYLIPLESFVLGPAKYHRPITLD